MEVKKSPKADLQNKKQLFTMFGLCIALLLAVGAFSINQGSVQFENVTEAEEVVEEQYVEITRPEEPPKVEIEKVAAPAATSNVLEAVDNSVELDDNMDMFDIEATENTVIDIQPIETVEEDLLEEDIVVIKAEVEPKFLGGGVSKFHAWVNKNVSYPEEAEMNNIAGRVMCLAVVGRDGFIRNVKVLVSPDESLSNEVRKTLMKSPKWVPAQQRGKPVSFQIQCTVNFQQINR